VWDMIKEHEAMLKQSGHFYAKRNDQKISRMTEAIHERLMDHFYQNPDNVKSLPEVSKQLTEQKITSYQAARQLLDRYFADKSQSH
jgi:LAO/AO transport system kinase